MLGRDHETGAVKAADVVESVGANGETGSSLLPTVSTAFGPKSEARHACEGVRGPTPCAVLNDFSPAKAKSPAYAAANALLGALLGDVRAGGVRAGGG